MYNEFVKDFRSVCSMRGSVYMCNNLPDTVKEIWNFGAFIEDKLICN